jgi:hypothetical protein
VSKSQKFWIWFQENNLKYFYLHQIKDSNKKEEMLSDFEEHLHEYCEHLYFEIGGNADEPQDLIISAAGNRDYFDAAEALVSAAPQLEDWNFIALKPPMGIDFVHNYEGITIDPRKLWFLPLEKEADPTDFGIRVYLAEYEDKSNQHYLTACYQILDTFLGEKFFALNIQHVELGRLPSFPEKNGLIPLSDLPEYIQWRNNRVLQN